MLDAKQLDAFYKFKNGENLFLTGAGGTGKTTLIRRMYEDALRRRKKIQVTALTGCASILLKCKARTIHSFAGIGLGTGSIEDNVKRVRQNSAKVRSWKSIEILVIDEISMMSKKLLELLDGVAKAIRQNNRPFGGIQIIFSGDFFQIRPVGRIDDLDSLAFCFESPLWSILFKKSQHVELTTVFRQKDPIYTKILTQIRNGCLDEEGEEILKSRLNHEIRPKNIHPIQLLPTRKQVDSVNQKELERLDSNTEKIFKMGEICMKDDFSRQRELDFLKKSLLCEESLRLRIGTQVMCIINTTIEDTFLCNGSQGVVQDFSPEGFPVIQFKNGLLTEMKPHEWQSEVFPDVTVCQIPLILAWAITIHKAQGATLESAEIDVGKCIFECGQMYVALSRIKDMEGLFLSSYDRRSLMIDPKVKRFYDQLK